MRQLVFDNDFKDIVDEKINYWTSEDDIPQKVKDFIKKITDDVIIELIAEDGHITPYCSHCLKELDDNYYCSHCDKNYFKQKDDKKYILNPYVKYINDIEELYVYFYVFDVIDDYIVLYNIVATLEYNHMAPLKYKSLKLGIKQIYDVKKDGLYEHIEGEDLKYSYIDKFYENADGEKINEDYVSNYTYFELPYDSNLFLYVDNLDDLKKSPLYEHSQIWKLKDYFNKNDDLLLSSLTYNPIHFPQFEYLIKMGLYNLAIYCSQLEITNGKSFKEAVGVDKKYYNFMKKHDINVSQFRILKAYPTNNYDLIEFIGTDEYIILKLKDYVDLYELKKYVENNNQAQNRINHFINDYYDYIMGLIKLGVNLKDKKVLYPKNFYEEHDRILSEIIITNNPELDKKIHNLANILSLNIYEDDEYIIFPADSVNSMIDESSQQHNCVRTYCERVGNNDCQIYFMRHKKDRDKSLVTVEVQNGKVVQARTRFNNEITNDQKKFLAKWEKQMIPIFKEND